MAMKAGCYNIWILRIWQKEEADVWEAHEIAKGMGKEAREQVPRPQKNEGGDPAKNGSVGELDYSDDEGMRHLNKRRKGIWYYTYYYRFNTSTTMGIPEVSKGQLQIKSNEFRPSPKILAAKVVLCESHFIRRNVIKLARTVELITCIPSLILCSA